MVGARAPRDGTNFATCVFVVSNAYKRRKMAFFEGCSVGWGGVPTGAGLVEVGKGLDSRGRGQGSGLAVGSKHFGSGKVGGRDTGPKDGANFATCVVFLSFLTRTKRRKMAFFEGSGAAGLLEGLIPEKGVREGLAWRGKGSGGVQGLRFRQG